MVVDDKPHCSAQFKYIETRDLVINSVLVRIARSRVVRDLKVRTNSLSKRDPPYSYVFKGQTYSHRSARFVAIMRAYNEIAALPGPERITEIDVATSIAAAMLGFRKIVLVDAAQRASMRDPRALTSAKSERPLLELLLEQNDASLEEVAILTLVTDVLVAEIDQHALDKRTRESLLGSKKIVLRKITDAGSIADLESLYASTLEAVFVAWMISQGDGADDGLHLTPEDLLGAREIADLVRRYRGALARGRQPSRRHPIWRTRRV